MASSPHTRDRRSAHPGKNLGLLAPHVLQTCDAPTGLSQPASSHRRRLVSAGPSRRSPCAGSGYRRRPRRHHHLLHSRRHPPCPPWHPCTLRPVETRVRSDAGTQHATTRCEGQQLTSKMVWKLGIAAAPPTPTDAQQTYTETHREQRAETKIQGRPAGAIHHHNKRSDVFSNRQTACNRKRANRKGGRERGRRKEIGSDRDRGRRADRQAGRGQARTTARCRLGCPRRSPR